MAAIFAKISADLDSNPKIRRAGRNGREVFCFVLRRNALLDAPGRIPVSNVEPWYLADQLQMSEADAEEGVSRCVRTGLLVLDGPDVAISGWDDEWGRRPLTEAERKKKQRARAASTSYDSITVSDVTKRPDGVTPERDSPECHTGEESRVDKSRGEVDPESQAKPAQPLQVKRAGRAGKARGPRPTDWAPRERERAIANEKGLDCDAEAVSFADNHDAKGSVFADWNAAFRTWLGLAVKFGRGKSGAADGVRPTRWLT